MLLNKIPVLDHGYVALISSTLPAQTHSDVVDEFFKAQARDELNSVCFAVVAIKAPIFTTLVLSQYGFTLVPTRHDALQAYQPSVGEIGSPDLETNRLISEDIARTSEALLINPSAYAADGADKFISQIIMPVSTYSTFIVGGSLEQWQKFYKKKNVPAPIRAYADAIEQVIKAEWRHA